MYEFLTTKRTDRLFLVNQYLQLKNSLFSNVIIPDLKENIENTNILNQRFSNDKYTPLINVFNDILPKKALLNRLTVYIFKKNELLTGYYNTYYNEYCGVFFNAISEVKAILCVNNKYIRQFKYACYVGNIPLAMQYCVFFAKNGNHVYRHTILNSVECVNNNALFYPDINKLKIEKRFNSIKELYNYSLVEIPNIIKEHIDG